MKVMISNICEAFNNKAVGSKIKDGCHGFFLKALKKAIRKHDFSTGLVKGQAVIDLPKTVNKWVSPGSWYRNSTNVKDFVLRKYRGEVGTYLKRNIDATSKRVRCVVYTTYAYMRDPDMTMGELKRLSDFFKSDDGYVLVAVLGDPDENASTVSYSRFVKNLAGANNEYKVMKKADLVNLAKAVDAYRSHHIGVAD